MRKMITYCDRCGREFEKWNDKGEELIGVAEFVYDHSKQYLDCQKDLCKSCYDELEKWWNSGTAARDTDTEPVKEHKDVNFKFYIGDKVRTLVEMVDGYKLFPVGTIGVITNIDNDELPYGVYSEEFNDTWYYPEDALELIEED